MKISLNNVRLRGKMLILYFLSVLLPIVMTNLIFYQVTTHNVKKQKIRDISLAMEQIRNDFLSQINVAIGISSVLYTDNLLNDALEKDYLNGSDYVDSYYTNISETLYKYSPVYKAIKGVTIYTDNPTIIGGGGVLPITGEVRQTEWFKTITASKDSTPLVIRTDIQKLDGTEKTYSIFRKLDYFTYRSSRQKILRIDIDIGTIQKIFHNATLQGNLYLLDDSGRIEYATDKSIDWLSGHAFFDQIHMPADALKFEEKYTSVSYLHNWRVVGEFPESEILKEVRKSRNFVIYMAIPNILIPTLIILWITRSLNVRIIRILKHMKRVKNQHFETIRHEAYRDEIGQLTEEFNRMTLQIKKLIDDVYIAGIQRKDLELKRNQAQLHALQSQINPHFLFNALETIRMRSLIKQETETAKIIQNMARIFRKSLSWEKDWVTVSEEMNLIASFLEIQKYRFGDKLDYALHIDPDARDCMIPHMSVLPFVENASIHGIEQLKGKGIIELRIACRKQMLLCEIKDNGIGIPGEKLELLLRELMNEQSMGDHIGIRNVYYRLKMHYGDDFGFTMKSEFGAGTTISMLIPGRKSGFAE